MSRNRWESRLASLASLAFFITTTTEAHYIGLEPDRLVSLLELDDASAAAPGLEEAYVNAASGDWGLAEGAFQSILDTHAEARLGLAVTLSQLGRNEEALEVARSGPDSPKLRYARVLLELRAEPKVKFKDLRAELLELTSLGDEVFDLWLALNPSKKELKSHAKVIASHPGPVAAWQRAEIQLRLEKPKAALEELRDVAVTEPTGWLRNLLDLTQARALFEMKLDEEGESYYRGVLERLEPQTAERLFRDISSIASSSEWEEYPDLWDTDERKDFFRRFWKRRDPVPTRDDNPRIAGHYRRLARAVTDYPLQSTGRGYFTDKDEFLSLSPQLPYYDSLEFFKLAQRSRHWVDHRGVVFLRHGVPDRRIPERYYSGSDKTESWQITRLGSEPLAFHFVRRPWVGEWTLALNLGVASTRPSAPDDPRRVLAYRTRALGDLYTSRQMFLPLYQRFLLGSYRDLGRQLVEESHLMAQSVKVAMAQDSSDFYSSENILPLSVSISSFYAEGQPAIEVDFATDLASLDDEKLSPESELEVTVLVYDDEWEKVERRYEQRFRLGDIRSKGPKVFMASMKIYDLEPAEYRIAVELHQPDTDRYGLARGSHLATNLPSGDLGLSDLFLQMGDQKDSKRDGDAPNAKLATPDENILWHPVPTRVIKKSSPSRIYFELYNPEVNEDGLACYEIEERVVTLHKKPSVWSNLAHMGSQMAGAFFPIYTAAAAAAQGLFLSEYSGNEDLVTKRVVERPAEDTILESLETDLSELDKGVHTIQVTVHDLETGEITSRSITLHMN